MNFTIRHVALIALVTLSGCPRAETAVEKTPEKKVVIEAPRTAMGVIQQVHGALESNCGRTLHELDLTGLSEMSISDVNQAEADAYLEEIGLYAQQCGSYSEPVRATSDTCNPDCHWCPIKWYWCIENAGACAGGDNESCCKLGACGSKHHCEDVCKSSCGCDVPPLPSDGGGDGGDD
jgi:hypothetical protein